MVSSASQSPVSTSMGPPSTISLAAGEPVAVEAGAVGDAERLAHAVPRRPSVPVAVRPVGLDHDQDPAGLDLVALGHADLGHRARPRRRATACSIFMASSTTRTWPASTLSPAATATRTTLPGMGASDDPSATCSAATG